MTPESKLLAQIRAALGRRRDVRLFRNGTGAFKDKDWRFVRYGLCVGSPDLVGWVIRDGRAIFACIEVKSASGRVTPEQSNFLRVVQSAGGIAGCVRSVAEAEALVGPER